MYYIEALWTWRILRRYLIVLAVLLPFTAILFAILPHLHADPANATVYSAGGHAIIVAFICFLFASISGSSLSRHLDHLDFALTKPRPRAAFVATVFGIDVLGLGAFFVATAIGVFGLHIAARETHALAFDVASWFGIALSFGSVLAWYALVQALSCARNAAGWALAGVWVGALSLYFLSVAPLPIGPGMHALIVALNVINPIAYLTTVPFEATNGASASLAAHTVAIYLVAAAAALVALLRWQRVQT